jgi:aldose 1-epimerase
VSAGRRPDDTDASQVLEAGDARVVVRPDLGGRIASVVVAGRELLVTDDMAEATGPVRWGCYPMAPWAGRVRRGRFTWDGVTHQLPLGSPPHALHGLVYDAPWTVTGPASLATDLDERWPVRGRVEQELALDEDGLVLTMTLHAEAPMPAVIGWHPWFRRSLGEGLPEARLTFEAAEMLVRDAEGIPSGQRVPPPAGPWDDAFTGVMRGPALEWPGSLRLELSSTCAWWVVYSEPEHAICVEPQSGPPDALNLAPEVVEPGTPLVHEMRWRWTRL